MPPAKTEKGSTVDTHIEEAEPAPALAEEPGWTIIGLLPCLQCRYDLQGLSGVIVSCPECGHANDLRWPEEWEVRLHPAWVRNRRLLPNRAALIAGSTVVLLGLSTLLALPTASLAALVLLALGLPVTGLILWIRTVHQWTRTCTRPGVALLILMLHHMGAFGPFLAPLGLFVWFAGIRSPDKVVVGLAMWIIIPLISLLCLKGAGTLIRRGEHNGLYRQSAEFSLPLERFAP